MCNGGQAFKQSQRVVRGNVFSPTTQADQKTETKDKTQNYIKLASSCKDENISA